MSKGTWELHKYANDDDGGEYDYGVVTLLEDVDYWTAARIVDGYNDERTNGQMNAGIFYDTVEVFAAPPIVVDMADLFDNDLAFDIAREEGRI